MHHDPIEDLPADDDESPYLLYKTDEPLPLWAFGPLGGEKRGSDGTYYLKVSAALSQPDVVVTKVYVKLGGNNRFVTGWWEGPDPVSGDPVRGIRTEVTVSIPKSPVHTYIKNAVTSMDPCADGV